MPSYQVGDVVVRRRRLQSATLNATVSPGTLGTICKVVTPGRTYRVIYEDFPVCVPVGHDAVQKAPAGSSGPTCPEKC